MTQITPERLNELIDFHEQLRCKLAADHHITEACKADDVVQALRHYRELRASDAWQPIETLPDDPGQHVLAFGKWNRCVHVVYCDGAGKLYQFPSNKPATEEFTHWRTLPAAPSP